MNNNIQLYYNAIQSYYAGQPIMSDPAFDALESQLLAAGEIANKIRFEPMNTVEVQHAIGDKVIPLVSLSSILTKSVFDEKLYNHILNDRLDDVTRGKALNVLLKYDGMSCEATYIDGLLKQIVTKGNGTVGYDVTEKFVKTGKVPMSLKEPITCQIRFEACISTANFEAHLKESGYKNERNAAAGIVKSKNMQYMEFVDPVAYIISTVMPHKNLIMRYDRSMMLNDKLGWPDEYTASDYPVRNAEEFVSICKQYADNRQKLTYRIDGLVIRPIQEPLDWASQSFVWENGVDYEDMVALKFDAQSALTKVTRIDWRQRIDGEVFPRVELEPVELDGTTVKAASGFNWGFLRYNKIYPGSLVRIEKGGDIIPDIQECVMPGEHDEHVDTCDLYQWPEHAYTDGIHLMMPEEFAYDTRLAKGIMGLNVDGLGGTTAWKITEHLKFMQSIKSVKYRDYATLYDLFYLINAALQKSDPVQHLTTALGLSTYSKMDVKVAYGLIERFKTIHLSHFIECLRLPGVGGKVAYCTALELLGEKVDYFGLEKDAVDSIRHNTELIHFLDFMKHHENAFKMPVEQVVEKDDTLPTLYIVMTGSPKVAGYKTKGEFVNALNTSVVGLVNIIDAGDKFNLGDTVLIAPSADATSNKAKGALNAGATILTYYDAVSTISTKYKK